mgnify:FL=1
MKTDVLIIGGGVIGCAVAYELARYELDVTVVEKNSDIANGTSKANSGICHNGMGEKPGTICSSYVTRGYALMKDLCEQLYVPYSHCVGSVTAAFNDEELKKLERAKMAGEMLGIHDTRIVHGDELFDLEPGLNRALKYALYNPGLSTVSSYELTIALGESAAINGVHFLLDCAVTSIECSGGKVECVRTTRGDIQPQVVINAAGLYADRIAAMVEEIDFEIRPRKGEYFLYDKKCRGAIRHIVSDLGSEHSKAMIIAPTVHGNILAGSSATMIERKDDLATHGDKLDMIYDTFISRMIPALPRAGQVITTFAGNRAAATSEDFIIQHARTVKGFINLAGMQSPALTSAPAIAQDTAEMVAECGLKLTPRKDYKPFRPKPVRLSELTPDELNALIRRNPDYGEIICRCETISKGEILDAIRSPIPAITVDAVKRRARAGMGRCQGGFCGPRVMDIIARELGKDMTAVNKSNQGSYMVVSRTKEAQK